VQLPCAETVRAVPTGCSVARSDSADLSIRADSQARSFCDRDLVYLGAFCSTDVETTVPAAADGVVSQLRRQNTLCWSGR
jgi:hypothetical protein